MNKTITWKTASTFLTRKLAFIIALAAVTTVAGAVLMTPGSGILSAPVFVRADFVDPTDLKFKVKGGAQEVIHVAEAQQTVMQEIVIGPGGHTGWHSHPGPVVVLIKSGTMSFYDGDDPTCTERTYSAGEAFIDSGQGHVHIARNEGTDNLEIWATYFDVPPPPALPAPQNNFRINAPAPGNCSF